MATQNRAGKAAARKTSAKPASAGQSAAAKTGQARSGQSGQAGQARTAGQQAGSGQQGRPGQQGRGGQRNNQAGRDGQQGKAGQGPAKRTEQPLPARAASSADESTQPDAGAPAVSLWRRALSYPGAHKLEFATIVVSVLGLAVSIYLTIEHFTQNSYALCPANATFNCGKVTTSAQSHVFGIPVAVLGLAFFVFMVAINSPRGWRATQPAVHWARLASVIVGIVFVLYLVYAELFLINAICLYCTSVHILTFILFALIVGRTAMSGVVPQAKR